MSKIQLIKFSIFTAAIAAMVAFTSQAQAQFASHGGGIHFGNRGVSVHSGGFNNQFSRYGNHFGGYGTNSHYRGNRNVNHGSGFGNSHYGNGYSSVRRIPAHTWHDTSHYDYQPARIVRHGNHYDYQPGRYQFHRSGHVDHNHR